MKTDSLHWCEDCRAWMFECRHGNPPTGQVMLSYDMDEMWEWADETGVSAHEWRNRVRKLLLIIMALEEVR